ncbi:MAG: hypothetical protein ACR2LI_12950 [Propionibacteriaceae bacterium]
MSPTTPAGSSPRPIEELAIPYDPVPTWNRIARYQRLLRGRLIGLAITVVILAGITIWQRERAPLAFLVLGNVIVLGLALAAVGVTWWLARRARSAVRTLGEGVALRVGRSGVELVGRRTRWDQLASLDVVKGPLVLGPRLRVRDRAGAEVTVPWDQLEVKPATLDTAARAYSGGRHGVDLSGLEA